MNRSEEVTFVSASNRSVVESTVNESHMLMGTSAGPLEQNSTEEIKKTIDGIARQFSHAPISFDSSSVYYVYLKSSRLCFAREEGPKSFGELRSARVHRRVSQVRRRSQVLQQLESHARNQRVY